MHIYPRYMHRHAERGMLACRTAKLTDDIISAAEVIAAVRNSAPGAIKPASPGAISPSRLMSRADTK